MSKQIQDSTIKVIIKWSVIGILAIILLCSAFYTIKSTERGVLSTFGKYHESSITDGLHVKIPFIQSVKKVNIQQKKFDGVENSYTRDVQTSEVNYTINYDLNRENVYNLIKNVGDDYHNRIVVPFIRSAVKEVFGNYAATEIVENRDKVRRDIEALLRRTVDSNYCDPPPAALRPALPTGIASPVPVSQRMALGCQQGSTVNSCLVLSPSALRFPGCGFPFPGGRDLGTFQIGRAHV